MDSQIFTDVIILAGGIGERLWPASRPDYPKQFISLSDGVSFLQSSILRALAVQPTGKIIVITRSDLLQPVSEHCAHLLYDLDEQQRHKLQEDLLILAEPCARHTCAPLMLSCELLELMDNSAPHTMLVLASDHVISPVSAFAADCRKAAATANDGYFVCFAIPPNEPATGYGYIKEGAPISADGNVFAIAQFKEKPDEETARQYLASGSYTWNSGMFAFTSAFFKEEVRRYEPDIAGAFKVFAGAQRPEERTVNGIKYISNWAPMEEAYRSVPAVAVDNAIAERTGRAAAVRASFGWDDVGSWDAFEKLFSKNDSKTVEIKGGNNFVYSDIPVALCGVEDLVVVIKNGSALIMKKGASGMMREVVQKVKSQGKS